MNNPPGFYLIGPIYPARIGPFLPTYVGPFFPTLTSQNQNSLHCIQFHPRMLNALPGRLHPGVVSQNAALPRSFSFFFTNLLRVSHQCVPFEQSAPFEPYHWIPFFITQFAYVFPEINEKKYNQACPSHAVFSHYLYWTIAEQSIIDFWYFI